MGDLWSTSNSGNVGGQASAAGQCHGPTFGWSEASGLWSARRSIPEHQKFVDHQMESSPFRRGRPDHPAVKEKAGSRDPAGSLASPKQDAALANQGFIAPVALV